MESGDIFYMLRGPGGPYKHHVLAIVDEDMVVYKWYGRHRQKWHYEVERLFHLKHMIEMTKTAHM